MKKLINITILLAVIIAARGVSYAVPSRDGVFPGPKDAVRPREVIQVYDEKTKSMRAIRISGRAIRVAVIPVQFTSDGTQSTPGSYTITSQNLLDMAANLTYLQNFFNEACYGNVVTTFTVVFNGTQKTIPQITGSESAACIILNNSMSHYANTPTSVGYLADGTGGGQPELIEDAVTAAGVVVSSNNFDTVIVVHAGNGNESTAGGTQKNPHNPGDIWSVQVDFGGQDPKANGLSYGITVPMMELGASPVGVCCHEFGHFLGLPDMYDTNSGDSVVGDWCLMDSGCWGANNDGLYPTPPCVFCKNCLGLVTPQVISSSQQVSGIAPVETSASAVYQFNIPNRAGEYFLVCYTAASAYNSHPIGTGVLIWHVDEADMNGETFSQRITNNDINNYRFSTAALVPANGMQLNSYYLGSSGDPWPGHKTIFTAPDSNSYSRYSSGIALSNFLHSSPAASFYASIDLNPPNYLWSAAAFTPRVYPNPFKPSIHNSGITFDGLAYGARIKIYDVAGELVQSGLVDSSNAGRINWNGKNDSGRMLASGIYIARIEGSAGTVNLKIAVEK